MGLFKKFLGELGDSVKKSVEERKQELLKSVEDRKQELLKNVEDRKNEALAKIGLMSTDSNNNYNNDRNNSDIDDDEQVSSSEVNDNLIPNNILKGSQAPSSNVKDETIESVNNSSSFESKLTEPEVVTNVKKKMSGDDSGVFSGRLEALIRAALHDGVLTETEKAVLKKRAEAEGEDWDEVEMIIEARLAEMNPVASAPSSETTESNHVSQSRIPLEQKKQAKEVLAIKVDEPISKEYKRTQEDNYATSIEIPEGVTIISKWCFSDCKNLESVTLPSTIKNIGMYAFEGCSSLTSIEIPEGVTVIPQSCFSGCKKLESVTLPSTIKQIEQMAFEGCSSLTSIEIPEGVTVIPEDCFSGCKKLKSITLPTTITTIEFNAVFDCNKLKSLSIPNGCERLEQLNIDIFDNIVELFLPPTLCAVDEIHGCDFIVYCFSPHLEDLESFANLDTLDTFYVLPQYLDSYKSQAEAEGFPSFIDTMPEEYLYYYDN